MIGGSNPHGGVLYEFFRLCDFVFLCKLSVAILYWLERDTTSWCQRKTSNNSESIYDHLRDERMTLVAPIIPGLIKLRSSDSEVRTIQCPTCPQNWVNSPITAKVNKMPTCIARKEHDENRKMLSWWHQIKAVQLKVSNFASLSSVVPNPSPLFGSYCCCFLLWLLLLRHE